MTQRRMRFEHDGHLFQADEERTGSSASSSGEPQVRWVVQMNGAPALEFQGAFPFRDEDVKKRVLEWYEIQKPRGAPR